VSVTGALHETLSGASALNYFHALQLKARIIANVSALDPAPGVAFHERAPDAMDTDDFADRSGDVSPPALPIVSVPGSLHVCTIHQHLAADEGPFCIIHTLLMLLSMLRSPALNPPAWARKRPSCPVKQHCNVLRCMRGLITHGMTVRSC